MSNNSKNFLVKKGLDVTTGLINGININDLDSQGASDGYVLTATSSGTFTWEPTTEGQIPDLDNYVSFTELITTSGILQTQIDTKQVTGDYITASGVTYENLNDNGDVGPNSSQIAQGDHDHSGVYEPADSTILKDVDIGVNVQAYDADIVSDASYVHTDNNYTTIEKDRLAELTTTSTFLDLVDTPLTYSNSVDNILRVTSSGIGFVDGGLITSISGVPTEDTVGSEGDFCISSSTQSIYTKTLTEIDTNIVTAKSVIFDFTDNWGSGIATGIRQVDFYYEESKLVLTATDFTAYATDTLTTHYDSNDAFDTSLSKIGSSWDTSWMSNTWGSKRLIVVFDSEQTFDSIVINNYHYSGLDTSIGAKTTEIYISSDSITDTVYGNTISNSTLVFDGQLNEHVASNTEDEQTLEVTVQDAQYSWEVVLDLATLSGTLQTQIDAKQNTTITGSVDYFDVDTVEGALQELGIGKQYWENVNSAGRLYGGVISDAGGGLVNISAGKGLIKTEGSSIDGDSGIPTAVNEGQGSKYELVTWDTQSNISLAGVGYNLIYWDASTGQFAVALKENFYSVFNFVTDFTIGRVYYDGSTVLTRLCGMNKWNFDRRVQMFGEERFPVERAFGLALGEIGNRNLTVTAGVIWAELVNRFSIDAIDTSDTDTFTAWYRDGSGGWTSITGQTQINNTQYDDGSGTLATLSNNEYGIHWVYVNHIGDLHVVYGQDSYRAVDIDGVQVPAVIPGMLAAYASLIGKISIRKNASSFYTIQSAFETVFSRSSVTNHNELASLQGGGIDEYYHVTADEYSGLSDSITHITSNGIDHTYIDQDVTSSGSPIFVDTTINTIQLSGAGADEGLLGWDYDYSTASLTMGSGVIQQIGEEIYYTKATYNDTGSTIPNGTPIILIGRDSEHSYIAPAISDNTLEPINFLGLATETIPNHTYGRITFFGRVNNIDLTTSGTAESGVLIEQGDLLYISSIEAGKFTNIRPESPNKVMFVGNCLESGSSGVVTIRNQYYPNAVEVSYDNNESGLLASNTQSAIDELEVSKASIAMLSSNIVLFPTTASGAFGYNKLVTSVDDVDYNAVAVDVGTGSITTDDQLILGFIAEPGLFVGSLPYISSPSVSNVAKITGNSQQYASFYLEIYQMDSEGTETLLATSTETGSINTNDSEYHQYYMSTILDGTWTETDRIIIKLLTNLTGNAGSEYNFQLGGISPARTELPVPVSVIPSVTASGILVDTINFNNILNGTDDDVQSALETLDNHNHTTSEITDFDTEVSNNSDVTANTSARHIAVTVSDSPEIDFTLDGQDITASIKNASINKTKFNSSVTNSLDLADNAVQPGDLASVATAGTFTSLTDTPSSYVGTEGFYAQSTGSGIIWLEGSSASVGMSELTDYLFGSATISGTGDIHCNDLYTAGESLYIGNLKLSTSGTTLLIGDDAEQLEIGGGDIELPNTTHENELGIIYKNGIPFIHDFNYGDNGTAITEGKNVFIGDTVGNFTMGETATTTIQSSYNVCIGYHSFEENTTGYNNIAIGDSVLNKNSAGIANIALGKKVLFYNIGGCTNIGVGNQALYENYYGSSNVAIGDYTLNKNTYGGYNTAIGSQALFNNTTGEFNCAVGRQAGRYITGGTVTNQTGNNNIFIGSETKAAADGDTNEIVIGYNTTGIGSNSVTLGNTNIEKTLLRGNVGIETSEFGTNAGGVLGLANGYTPTTSPIDMVQMWAGDYAAGDSRLYIMTENSTYKVIIGDGNIETEGTITGRIPVITLNSGEYLLTTQECSGTQISNFGQVSDVTAFLPSADSGLSFTVTIGTTYSGTFNLKSGMSDKIYLNGTAIDYGNKVSLSDPTIGDFFEFMSFQTGSTTYDWIVRPCQGTLTDGGA